MTKFYTNGTLDDETGTGITLASVPEIPGVVFESVSPTGSHGYRAKEISKEEYEIWQQRISSPDMVNYFPGIFPGVGVVNEAVYSALQAAHKRAIEAEEEVKLSSLAASYKMAEAVAKATGQPAVEILKAFRPDLSDQTLAALESKA